MKWLFRIIIYLFPRKRWTTIENIKVWDDCDNIRPVAVIVVQKDQFGNIRQIKIKN